MRPMSCTKGNILKKRPTSRSSHVIANLIDCLINQVFGQVVPILVRDLNRMVVTMKVGMPVVGVAAQESVPAAEPSPKRPIIVRAGSDVIREVGQMPLADGVSPVRVLRQHLGDSRGARADAPLVAGKTARPLGYRAYADRMRVATGQ